MCDTTKLYEHIGNHMKHRRITSKKRLVTQSDLARACNVTFQQIQKYEKATNKIPLDKLLKVAKYLDTPLLDFIPKEETSVIDQVMIGQINDTEQQVTSK